MEELQIIAQARRHADNVAILTDKRKYSYADLLTSSSWLATGLLNQTDDLSEARVAFLVPAGSHYVTTQWGIWRAGGVAVPLSHSATLPELEYTLRDSGATLLVTSADRVDQLRPLCEKLKITLHNLDDDFSEQETSLPEIKLHRRAMILYTSGTTSQPKGVVTTHANIQAQIESLVEAWEWQATDSIPLFLPLHHIHGIINILSCALFSGATVEPFPRFDIDLILNRVASQAYTLFMAVPTIYVKLIQKLESLSHTERAPAIAGFSSMRLMVSGSAALPATVHETWTDLTGQQLLERYGMTEIGMALANPYIGERKPGAVGLPLPGVEIRLMSEQGELITAEQEPGEIQVKGDNVFLEYWNRQQETEESFTEGWFQTGDVAICQQQYYQILGRQTVDIIKSGGYKLSALEIEATLLQHPLVSECAVVGIADETWGEAVAAAVVTTQGCQWDDESMRLWCRDLLSHYKIPKRFLTVNQLPRNAMGKVTKPAVCKLFEPSTT